MGRIKPDDFVQIDNQSFLSAEGKKKWCQYYEEYMQTGVKEYGGISPRDLIRNQIQVFFREEIEKIVKAVETYSEQPVEYIDNTLVIYSLGNFISAQSTNSDYNTMVELMTSVDIVKTTKGFKKEGKIINDI
mgnify:CR=1 FL=1